MKDIILIVDDAREDLDLFQAMLEEHGYKVTRACDGREGLQKIKQDAPLVVISDVMMPHMNGYAFLKEIRHDQSMAKIPVLIVTARPKMADALMEIGADSFIAKPINGSQFLIEVDKLVNRVKRARLDDKKSIIFGKSGPTLQDMHQKLVDLGCAVTDITDEQKIIAAVEEIDPDLFFLGLDVDTKVPIDLLVYILSHWTIPKKAIYVQPHPAPEAPGKMRIILYEEERSLEKIWISEAGSIYDKANDNKMFVQKCCKNGALGYIGAYSSQDFTSQIQKFLYA
ncbi:MAG TPA: response regulator [Candidatus Omnitrophota bacterium]|nr:response regulator [Candidatus Omnitrophota bacterium]